MDYLRSIGSAAASSLLQKSGITLPFSLGEKVISFEGKSIWSLYDAVKRDDSSPVSVFFIDGRSGSPNWLPLAKNALRKLRTVRHPDILKFIDVVETETTIHIVTERVQPLAKVLHNFPQGRNEDWLLWGLHRVATALAFVNESCASTHGNVRTDSVFVAMSGEWKLGGFEVLSSATDEAAVLYTMGGALPDASGYISPEVAKSGYSVLKELPSPVFDAYGLGLLIHALFNPSQPLPSTSASVPPPRGSIPPPLFIPFKRLLNPSTKSRLTTRAFLDLGTAAGGFFSENRIIKICKGLADFTLAGESEKNELLRTLKETSHTFTPLFISHLVLPSLLTALQHAGATAPSLLPLILHLGTIVPPTDYDSLVVTPLVKLFASPDRGTRMALLDHLPELADKLDSKVVVSDVWPHLQTGFADTVAVIREATIRSIILISSKLSTRILNNDLLRHLARAQSDTEPSIRTNAAILLGRLAPSLSQTSRRKVLVPAFSRALKDTFVHARVAGLMAFMACGELFEPEEVARGVLPVVVGALVDGHKLVREQAFKTMEYFIKRLEEHARLMPEADQPTDSTTRETGQAAQATLASSAAGAAGALAGWALSSLGKKLTAGDMQTGIGGMENITASVASLSATTNGGNLALSREPQSFSATSVSDTPFSPKGKGKAMQLGSTRVSSAALDSVMDEWETQATAEVETTSTWNGDLMDVNADTDDWSAFETAPMPGSIYSNVQSNNKPAEPEDHTWEDAFDSQSPAISSKGLTLALPQKSSLAPPRASPERSASVISRAASDDSRDTADINRSRSPRPSAPSLAGMSKDEKAQELARRKEERKQRIAQLKEQKNKSASMNG